MLPDEMKAVIQRFVEEPWNNGNLNTLDELCDPNYTVGDNGTLQNIKDAITAIRNAAPDFKCVIAEMVVEGDWAAYHWTMTGTHGGEYMGIPATGKTVRFSGITMLRFANGKIVRDFFESSSKSFEEQVA
jgi:steroid delta-isomerase-like uncharacterized protein